MYKDLSLKEKAKVIREGVRLGLNSIDDILSLYDEAISYLKEGPIVSSYGQWKYPGRDTIIPYNNITMDNVNYPVLGISDAGDAKVMMPWNDYKFKGSMVYEHPLVGNLALEGKKFNKEWKALDNILYNVYPDTSFTREKTGIGDIEVFNRENGDTIIYPNGYRYINPYPGLNTIVYNPNTNDALDIRLDALHLMPLDATYDALNTLYRNNALGSDVYYIANKRYEEDKRRYGKDNLDSFSQYYNNEADGLLRNMFIEGTPEYIKAKRYYPNKQQLREWNINLLPYINEIQDYLETGERPKYILPEVVIAPDKYLKGGEIQKYLNVPDYNVALYNTVSPLGDFPNFWGALAYRRLVKDKLKNGNIYERDYKVGDTQGEKTAMAAWAKRLGIPYDELDLPVYNGDTVTLPYSLVLEIPYDTNMLKNRIQLNKALLNKYSKYRYSDVVDAAIKADLYNLDKLRETYKTGKPVGLTEFGWNNRLLVDNGEIVPIENIQSPLNVLGNYNVRYSPEERRLYYSDEYDFNQFENFVPGEPYRIRGYIDLDDNKALGGNLFKKGGIYINPKNKGKFNATKKRTGKTTEELTHSKNPLTRKRAIFAQNAKKWSHKHLLGSHLSNNFYIESNNGNLSRIKQDTYKTLAWPSVDFLRDWYTNRQEQINNLSKYRNGTSDYYTDIFIPLLNNFDLTRIILKPEFDNKLVYGRYFDLPLDLIEIYKDAFSNGVNHPRSTIIHEGTHVINHRLNKDIQKQVDDFEGDKNQYIAVPGGGRKPLIDDSYLNNPDEINSRLMLFRYDLRLDPKHKYTDEEILKFFDNGSLFKYNLYYSPEFVKHLINNVAYNDSNVKNGYISSNGGHLYSEGGFLLAPYLYNE